jgi:hypothetical protein
MQHDLQLRAAARAIYETCYAGEQGQRTSFEEAERNGTPDYRQVVSAAQQARVILAQEGEQLTLPVLV